MDLDLEAIKKIIQDFDAALSQKGHKNTFEEKVKGIKGFLPKNFEIRSAPPVSAPGVIKVQSQQEAEEYLKNDKETEANLLKIYLDEQAAKETKEAQKVESFRIFKRQALLLEPELASLKAMWLKENNVKFSDAFYEKMGSLLVELFISKNGE